MSIYCISDLHFSQSVPKQMDVFGNRWHGYTEKIIENWNKLIGESDTVVVPGDISWGLSLDEAVEDLTLLNSLNGKKIISKGNHDLWWQSAQKINDLFIHNGISTVSMLHNNAYIVEDKLICGTRGWFSAPKASPDNADSEKIFAREAIRAKFSFDEARKIDNGEGRELVAFFHFPLVYKDFVCRNLIELLHDYGIKRCYYGHIHGVYDIPPTFVYEDIEMIIVSADYLHFIPKLIV